MHPETTEKNETRHPRSNRENVDASQKTQSRSTRATDPYTYPITTIEQHLRSLGKSADNETKRQNTEAENKTSNRGRPFSRNDTNPKLSKRQQLRSISQPCQGSQNTTTKTRTQTSKPATRNKHEARPEQSTTQQGKCNNDQNKPTQQTQQNQNQSKQTRMGFFVLGRRSGGFTHV
jgi:hypothetical protein